MCLCVICNALNKKEPEKINSWRKMVFSFITQGIRFICKKIRLPSPVDFHDDSMDLITASTQKLFVVVITKASVTRFAEFKELHQMV